MPHLRWCLVSEHIGTTTGTGPKQVSMREVRPSSSTCVSLALGLRMMWPSSSTQYSH